MRKALLTITLGLALASMGVQAGNGAGGSPLDDPPIGIGAGWFETTATPPAFFWGAGAGAMNAEGPFTFAAGGPVTVSVVDAFLKGDVFEVFDFGGSLGTTSLVGTGGGSTGDPNVAWGDAGYSRGTFLLGAGPHSITISAIINPFGGGRGYLRVDEAAGHVPEAASTLGLALLGLASLAGCRRFVKS